jgi:hypothetical protein
MPLQLYKIASTEVGSAGASSIDFTNIPQGYTDLKVVVSARSTTGSSTFYVRFNGSSSNLTSRLLYGNGANALSYSATDGSSGEVDPSSYTTSVFNNADIYIPNYAGSNNKSVSIDSVNENNASQALAYMTALLWSNTAAINSISIGLTGTGNLAQYTTATLYGIL